MYDNILLLFDYMLIGIIQGKRISFKKVLKRAAQKEFMNDSRLFYDAACDHFKNHHRDLFRLFNDEFVYLKVDNRQI